MKPPPSADRPEDGARSGSFRRRGGPWVVAQSLLMLGTLGAGPVQADAWHDSWSRPLALLLLAGGAGFGIAGAVRLGPARTIFPEPKPDAPLVRDGVYARVRHPLYTSVILLSFAWALGWRSPASLAIAGLTAVFLDAKSRHEEGRLRRRFPDYDDYSRRTWRLLPWLY